MTAVVDVVGTAIAVAVFPLAVLWLLPALSDLAMLVRRRAPATGGAPTRASLLVLVPAHDEALTIAPCVTSLLAMRQERSRVTVVVVADNCSDETASTARALGATVLERTDPVRRGKPPAIAWALAQYDLSRFDAAVIIDADTVVEAGFADAIAAAGPLRQVALQAYHDTWNPEESWLTVLGELLAAVRYRGQYPAKAAAGLNVPLTGNGMVLGTDLLARAGWVDDSLTENWELYARYTERGERIAFAPEARLYAQEVQTMRQGAVQRRRWQAGRGIVFRHHFRPLLGSPHIGLHQKVDALAELGVPGPILHATVALPLAAGLLASSGTLATLVAGLLLAGVAPIAGWTALTWARHPRRGAIAAAFLRLPGYMLWRLTIAIRSIRTGRTRTWSRSPRHRPGVP